MRAKDVGDDGEARRGRGSAWGGRDLQLELQRLRRDSGQQLEPGGSNWDGAVL